VYSKFNDYRRNKTRLCNDALLPVILLILGVGLSQLKEDFNQPSRILMPDRLPLPQELLMNTNTYKTSDVTTADLFATLPESGSSFNV
jgi:hypothetical protein